MPHQCVKCNIIYSDDADLVGGCSCGAKAFFFLKKDTSIDNEHLSDEFRAQVLAAGPIILDIESIKITDGKYDLDVNALFGKKELIYQYEDGKYSIDLQESFRRHTR
jgi:predicted  nucleic acid-binding Zn-ribbon protein